MNTIFDELRSALYSVWHQRWLALAVAWGVCLIGWLMVAMVPNTYSSQARILVQLDDALAEQIGIGAGDQRRNIQRVRDTLTSSINLEKVVRSTRIGDTVTSPRQMEGAIAGLSKQIKVVSQQDNLFQITADSGSSALSDAQNAKLSQDIVQKMIDIFREENLAGGRGEMRDTLAFMDQQLATRQRDLEAAEQRRVAFEAKNPQVAIGGGSIAQRMETGQSELRGIDADLGAAQSALAAINGQLAGTPQMLPGGGPAGGAHSALAQASADLAAMRARGLTENHPDVIAQKNQVASLRAQAATEGSAGGIPNPAHSSLLSIKAERQASVQALESRRASSQGVLAGIGARQIDAPEVAAEATRISRDYDVLKQQYDKLLQDREELRLRGQVENERNGIKFQVIDPPTAPRAPAAPNRPVLLLFVLIAGLGAGVGAAFALGQLRSTFATTAKLERALDLPVLGAISHKLTDAARVVRARRMKYFFAAGSALGGLFALLLTLEFIQRGMVGGGA